MPWYPMRPVNVRDRLRTMAVVASSFASSFASIGSALAADDAGWNIIGRQGIVSLVLVPPDRAADQAAYEREIDRLCQPGQTCFLNFYTNSRGLPVTVPLPDGISNEATATFRRSTKQGAQMFMWSCRMKVAANACF